MMIKQLIMVMAAILLILLSGCSTINPQPIRSYLHQSYIFKTKMYLYHIKEFSGEMYLLRDPNAPLQRVRSDRDEIAAVLPPGTRVQLLEMNERPLSGIVDVKVKILNGSFAGKIVPMAEFSFGTFFEKVKKS